MTDDKRSMLPEELRRSMTALGYRTQNDLAEAIGVSRSSVSLWLDGKIGVPRPIAMLIRMLLHAQRRTYSDGSFGPLLRDNDVGSGRLSQTMLAMARGTHNG